ncbi:TPA: hypothetical protein J1Z77_000547 [Escherichia coli]|nr:hypothetical protein [Escherichia coli]HBA7890586.1 hypothetical protein [Escherichia coli]HBA7904697.1 hypothetical protein [Escherichia coli]
MGITSAGMQSRDAECGERIFTRTVRQVKQQTTVHYFVSPPRPPVKTNPQAKNSDFNPAGSGNTKETSCAFYLSRAPRFIPHNGRKLQKINTQNASIVRKNFQPRF